LRIWSIHPKYLDAKGLVALWRETLLAKKVLAGKTKGYKNHPQLQRFKESANPIDSINHYLSEVYNEALKRDYNFDRKKINWNFNEAKISVTNGQIEYEAAHLLSKLRKRDIKKFKELKNVKRFLLHPIFKIKRGGIEAWEITK
jgi:hypothetical protein